MADKQSEEDDEEGFVFGDFTSAPKAPTNQINGSDFISQTNNDDDDDDWSDFVTFNRFPNPNSITNRSNTSNSTQSTNSVTDQQVKLSAPEPDCSSESKPSQWNIIHGAIPLSVFGEEEEEKEESSAVNSSFNDKAQFFKSDLVRKDSNTNKSIEISDLIKDLYGSKDNGSGIKKDISEQIGNGSVAKLNSNGKGFDLVNGDNQEVEGDEEDEWEWRFKGADGEKDGRATGSVLKEDEIKAANGMAFDFETSKSWNIFNSDVVASKTNSAIMNSDTNKFELNSAKEQDIEDDNWGFKGAEESQVNIGSSIIKEDDSFNFKGPEIVSSIKVTASKEAENNAANGFTFNFETSTMNWSGFNSDVVGSINTNSAMVNFDTNGINFNSAEEPDAEDDSWDFKSAEESHMKVETSEVKDDGSWDFKGADVVSNIEVEASKDLQESSKTSQTLQAAVGCTKDMFGETNLFISPNGSSHQIGNVGFNNGFIPSNASENKIVSDVHPTISPKGIKSESNSNSVSGDPLTPSHQEISERRLGSGRGALPLSIFGDEELENDDNTIQSDVSTSVLTNGAREGIKFIKTLSIDELISSLCSQSAQNASVNSVPGPGVHAPNSAGKLSGENLADEDDDDDLWDFKGASTATNDENRTYGSFDQVQSNNVMVLAQPLAEPNLANHDNSIDCSLWEFKDDSLGSESRVFLESHEKLEMDELWKFYLQLKDELHIVFSHHLDNMKKNNGLSSFAGEDAEVKVHNGELQDLYNEMYKDNLTSEIDSDSLSGRKINLNGILQVLRGKKFQVIEAEYQLSNRLSLAETDTSSLVEVLHHVSSVLRILRLGSSEEHSSYTSTWCRVLSVCAKELKQGASLWKQAVDKKIHKQVLAESKGKKYILALGEIYRVVLILGSSAKVYKPWVLADSINSSRVYALLDECSTSWSSSGLEEAIRMISGPLEFHSEGTVKALLESIEHVHNLEMPLLDNPSVAHSETLCQLSLLSPKSLPGMKMVSWNGKQYFLKLANLWANTVNCEPPDLPCIYVG